MGRQVVWPDPEVRKLARRMVPCMDDHGRLRKAFQAGTAEGRLFTAVVEDPQAHYRQGCGIPLADRPGGIRQGVYVLTPAGALLASGNSNDPKKIAAILRKGLDAWEALPKSGREAAGEPVEATAWPAPEPGSVAFRTVCRDLPREGMPLEKFQKTWGSRWNEDTIWLEPGDVKALLPEALEKGGRREVPRELVARWARFHLLDSVRAFTTPFQPKEVERAELSVEVVSVQGDAVRLRYAGATRTSAEGFWRVLGAEDLNEVPERQTRGFEAELAGEAVWDRAKGAFRSFELVAVGTRWGGTQHNGRASKKWHDDRAPQPMGVWIGLADAGDPSSLLRLWSPLPAH